MATAPDDVRDSTIFERYVPLDRIFVHLRSEPNGYARPSTPSRVKKLVKEWDRDAAGVLLLSMRNDGMFACIDGHHRLLSAREFGEATLPGFIYIDLTIQEEARLYRRFGEHLSQRPMDRFHAAVVEGQETALQIAELLAEFGLMVSQTSGFNTGKINAVEALLAIHSRHGMPTLRDTIHLLHDTFGKEPKAYVGAVLKGTAAFVIRYLNAPEFKRKRLIDVMQKTSMSKITGKAASMREALSSSDAGTAWGRAMLFYYNANMHPGRGRLPEWKTNVASEETRSRVREQMKGNNYRRQSIEAARASGK